VFEEKCNSQNRAIAERREEEEGEEREKREKTNRKMRRGHQI